MSDIDGCVSEDVFVGAAHAGELVLLEAGGAVGVEAGEIFGLGGGLVAL